MNVKRLGRSFKWAMQGLLYVARTEQNFRVELLIGLAALYAAFYIGIDAWRMVVLVMMVALVLVLECVNTIIELMVDMLKPRTHRYAQIIKDIMAASVLISSIAAVIIGILLFYPYFAY